jgi:hypothetical protein
MTSFFRAGRPAEVVNAPENQQPQNFRPRTTMGTRAGRLLDEVPSLGPLTNLQGDWTGTGFSILSLPNQFAVNPTAKFRLMMNATIENTTFTPITGPIPDRGNTQPDIFFLGLTYMQKVSDRNTLEGIHVEPGIFLNLPANPVQTTPSVCRLATIPHGDAVLAQGAWHVFEGAPSFAVADTTPFTLDKDGNRINDTSASYMAPFTTADPPPNIPKSAVMNPNVLLQQFNDNLISEGKKFINTTVFQVNANPVGGIANVPPFSADPSEPGGITNIPFVVQNANATSLSSIFWINEVQNTDGSLFLVLQYSQTVLLFFEVPGPDGNMVPLFWPHIAVASLIKR